MAAAASNLSSLDALPLSSLFASLLYFL